MPTPPQVYRESIKRRILLLVGPTTTGHVQTAMLLAGMALIWAYPKDAVAQTIPVLSGEFEKLWTSQSQPGWLEGPTFDGTGGIWFTDLVDAFADPQQRPSTSIMRYDIASGDTEQKVSDAGGANGLAFDHDGRLLAAHGHDRVLTRRAVDDLENFSVLADNWQGDPLHGPNDIAVDALGGIYFTDFVPPPQEGAVYYVTSTGELQQADGGLALMNGIALSPSGDQLYVATTVPGIIFAYDVNADGTLSNKRVFAQPTGMTPDGLTVDDSGNLWAADVALTGPPPPVAGLPGSKIRVWNSLGDEILTVEPPEGVINLTFADDEHLYFTSEKSLYRVPVRYVPEPATWSMTLVMAATTLVLLLRHRHTERHGSRRRLATEQ